MGVTVGDRRRWAAALLNLSGLGAGYVYLGRWGLAVGSWLVSATLVVLANTVRASGTWGLWLGVYLVWLALMVRGGWKHGGDPDAGGAARTPSPGWRAFTVAGVLLAVVAGGLYVYRDLPGNALANADRAHAAGRCEDALGDYDRASRDRYEFTLTTAPGAARYGAESCRLLLTAERADRQHRYTDAITAYESYLERSDGRPSWDRAEQRLITARMAYADELAAEVAASDAGSEASYRAAARAYLAIRDHHPGSPEVGELPDRFTALYTAVTAPWQDEARPCEVLDDLRALGELTDLKRPESTQLARRATSALPDAALDCGRTHYRAKEYCTAVTDFDRVTELAQITEAQTRRAEKALGQALYRCGLAAYQDEKYTSAKDSLRRLVDDFPKDANVDRASDLLIDIEIAELTEDGTSKLPPPTASGGAPGGTVQVEIINDSPEPLEILYSGAETGRATLDACAECTAENSDLIDLDGYGRTCDAGVDRPSTTLRLTPGEYRMVVSVSSDSSVTPFSGTWRLSSGTAYSDCYYIETYTYGY